MLTLWEIEFTFACQDHVTCLCVCVIRAYAHHLSLSWNPCKLKPTTSPFPQDESRVKIPLVLGALQRGSKQYVVELGRGLSCGWYRIVAGYLR